MATLEIQPNPLARAAVEQFMELEPSCHLLVQRILDGATRLPDQELEELIDQAAEVISPLGRDHGDARERIWVEEALRLAVGAGY